MFKIAMFVGLTAFAGLSAASVDAQTNKQRRQYTAAYDGKRDLYCLRLYSDGQAADPRPNVHGTNCRAKAAWAREGVFIEHHQRGVPTASR